MYSFKCTFILVCFPSVWIANPPPTTPLVFFELVPVERALHNILVFGLLLPFMLLDYCETVWTIDIDKCIEYLLRLRGALRFNGVSLVLVFLGALSTNLIRDTLIPVPILVVDQSPEDNWNDLPVSISKERAQV